MMMAVIAVRVSTRSRFGVSGRCCSSVGLKNKAQNSRADHEYCCKNGYLHLDGSSGCRVSHARSFEERRQSSPQC